MNKRIFTCILTLTLLLSPWAGSVRAQSPAKPPQPASKTDLPAALAGVPGAGADWWTTVQEDIRQSEYHVTWQDQTYLADTPAAYQAPNRAQNLRAYFTPAGVRLIPRVFAGDAPPWEWGLSLSGYGYANAPAEALPAPTLIANANRIDYSYPSKIQNPKSKIIEWFVNDERGLEHGFTLNQPPAGANAENWIVLDLTLTGDLTPRLTGSAVEFATPGGVTVLRYGDLRVNDAAGRELSAHFELTAIGVRISLEAAGAAYPITVDPLATTPAWSGESNQAYSYFGDAVATAGDVNNDGYDDIIIGADGFDNGQTDEGRVYLYYGSLTGPSTTADWDYEGNQNYAYLGGAVATAGDVNNDDYDDVIIGASNARNGQSGEGRAFVFHGSATGLGDTPNWSGESDQASAYYGAAVGTAGDVNNDGFADIIVGAYSYDNNQTNEGRAYVYHGSSSGLSTTANWTAESNQSNAQFGASAGTAGDVNGDGYSDVIVGAPGYANGKAEEGCAFVYHGSSTGLNSDPAWEILGDQPGAEFGRSVGTAGDVNGDGYADVIVGAPDYDHFQTDEGRARVYLGGESGLNTDAAWVVESNQADARLGFAVGTAGDVDGDGYSDVIVGVYSYSNGQSDEGQALVYNGSAAGLSATPDWAVESDRAEANFGYTVATAGDVNGDGFADIIVGAPNDSNGQAGEGTVHVYYGSAADSNAIPAWTAEPDQNAAGLGYAVSVAGDVNGDGYSDVIVGANLFDNGQTDEGRAFVYHGSATGLSTSANWNAESDQAAALFGCAVATAGDVNGDGYADVVVGACYYDNGQSNEGRAFVYHGSAAGLNAAPAWTGESDRPNSAYGIAVGAAGDVNGDGYSDLIVGADRYYITLPDQGQAYIYHGGASGLNAAPAWTATGDMALAHLGNSVKTAGDVNGDGYADVIVGAYWYNSQTNGGRIYVYHGAATGVGTTAAWIVTGDQPDARLGCSVGTAGDVNGDGYSDVIIGASGYDNGENIEGRAFLYRGGASGLSAAPAWTIESNQAHAQLGIAVGTAGDVNGDGYSDVIVGASTYDNGQTDEGRVFIYNGGPDGLSAASAWSAESNQADAHFGYAVGTAGDVNGDGYSDVIVGAPDYTNGQGHEGRAFVYHGGPSSLSTAPVWNAESDQAEAGFGYAVGAAGDVNGDGYADVIVGAPDYDHGQANEGGAFVYHGAAAGLSAAPVWSAESDQADAHFGYAVGAAGDVDGDGYSDVIVGAPDFDNGEANAGAAFVYRGGASGLNAAPLWSAESDQANARFGCAAATAGDVNGDGFADIVVGAQFYDNGQTDEGRAFAYYGAATGPNATPDWSAERDQADASFGIAVATAGDVNRDGYSDVVIGASRFDGDQTDEGRAYLYQGSAAGLSSYPNWNSEGNLAYLYYGATVGTAGDVNGDGYSDIIVGGYNFGGQVNVFHGAAGGLVTVPAWSVAGNQENSRFAIAAGTAGDVNGDGYSDVIVGGDGYDNDQVNEGRAFVYHGSAAGLSRAADWVAEGNQVAAGYGYAVGTAGDVNGDGFADVIVGAHFYDNDEQDEGRAFIYYGNGGDGLTLRPRQLRSNGATPIARLGMSDARTEFQLSLIGAMPLGRADVRLQWQVAPLGVEIGSPTVSGIGNWTDLQTAGVELDQTVTGLTRNTPYHWRVRLLYRPGNALGQTASRWIKIPWGSRNETDLRTCLNQAPIADAGPDQVVEASAAVTLNGSASSDPEGNIPLTYYWTQTTGPAVSFTPNLSVTAFTAPAVPATLIFSLVVTDSQGAPDPTPDTVIIAVANHPPVANAGPDQSVNTNAAVTLNGSASSDPDGGPLSYAWTQTGGPAVSFTPNLSVTGFAAPGDPAVLTFTLAVTDSLDLADPTPDTIVVTVNNQPPDGSAGLDQSVDTNAAVTLSAAGSADPDGDYPLAYRWVQTGGPAVSFTPNLSETSFTAPGDPAALTFSLLVTDSLGLADPTPDSVSVAVNNRPPVANAGADQTVNTDVTVALDGSASADPDGDVPLAYRWAQTGGPAVSFTPHLSVTTFTAPSGAAVLTFTLAVTDSLGLPGLASDEVVVAVVPGHINQPPVADAGEDLTATAGSRVTLDGSASNDPDGNTPLAYRWAQTGGPAVTFAPQLSVITFTAPASAAVLTFTLAVTDSLGLPDPTPDEVVITVLPVPFNRLPVANAGTDQTVDTGVTVALDGSASSDKDGDYPLTYAWAQTGGPAVSFTPHLSVTTFTAPASAAVLTFTLTVTDSRNMPTPEPDEVVVTVVPGHVNQPPVANAGEDRTANANAIVTLDGSASSDPDGNTPLAYRWAQTGGPAVTFTPQLSVITFTAPASATVLTFTLAVTDSLGLPGLAPDEVVVAVQEAQQSLVFLPLVLRQ